MKIDVFNHILTPKFNGTRLKLAPPGMNLEARIKALPTLWDLDQRFRLMDEFDDYVQILTLANPPVEVLAGPEEAASLARMGNDELAELVAKYPDRFLGAVASVPMNNLEAALQEIDRAIQELGFKGIQIYTHVNGRPLDHPEFAPVFEKMAGYDLPIWLHPGRNASFSDYPTEDQSQYEIWHIFGWPYDSTAAMTRLVFTGLFDKYPNLKIVTHHLGGLVPYTEERIREGFNKLAQRPGPGKEAIEKLQKHPYDYFRLFYADTATNGSIAALECGVAFFGVDRVLFATDMPFDSEGGCVYVRDNIKAMAGMTASVDDKHKIYEGNAKRLCRLS